MNKGKILIVGIGGQMGGYYTDVLLNSIGFTASQIIGVDIDSEKIKKFREKYPDIEIFQNLDKAFAIFEPGSFVSTPAIVVTNTPSHHVVIIDLIRRGIRHIFAEKPLSLNGVGADVIRNNLTPNIKIFSASLINFSKAVLVVQQMMEGGNLFLSEASVNWGKDRTGSSRPTPGDLEDEAVHGIALVHMLANINQYVRSMKIFAQLSYLPYADAQVQKKAHGFDRSFPMKVNSSSFITEILDTDNGQVHFGVHSSYVNIQQVRQVNLTLSSIEPKKPRLLVQLDFDTKDGDILCIKEVGAQKEIVREIFSAENNKVLAEIEAFLRVVNGEKPDPRLTNFAQARFLVAISDAAKRSAKRGQFIVVT